MRSDCLKKLSVRAWPYKYSIIRLTEAYLNGTPVPPDLRPKPVAEAKRELLLPWWKPIVESSEAVAALNGRCRRIETAFTVFECPMISPVEEPVSNMNAWPNLAYTAR